MREAIVGRVPSSDGVTIVYEARGEGAPALVFVHGWSCDRSYWRAQVESFSREYRVVAVDLAGHGDSGTERATWTIESFGEDVAAVVRDLEIERAVLIGHSMGGDVIVEAARRLPGRVAGLIWVDTYKQLRTPRSEAEMRSLLAPYHDDFAASTRDFVHTMFRPDADAALVERVAADMSSAPPEVAIAALESAMRFDRRIPPALRELNLPVVAINHDYRPTDVESLEACGVHAMRMSGVGHFPMIEDPERFDPLLQAAIRRVLSP
jgi:pimeloyl-ACP methyl ester carboxylesterase